MRYLILVLLLGVAWGDGWIVDGHGNKSPFQPGVGWDDTLRKPSYVLPGNMINEPHPDKIHAYIGYDYEGLVDTVPKNPAIKIITMEELLSLYDQYAKECYADSTYEQVTKQWTIHDFNVKTMTTCDTIIPATYDWIHKEPTFTGFMEWLREHTTR